MTLPTLIRQISSLARRFDYESCKIRKYVIINITYILQVIRILIHTQKLTRKKNISYASSTRSRSDSSRKLISAMVKLLSALARASRWSHLVAKSSSRYRCCLNLFKETISLGTSGCKLCQKIISEKEILYKFLAT